MSDELFPDGAAYERLMGRWSGLAGDVFLDWLAPSSGLGWLDVGCGNGAFTERLIERAAPSSVDAVDPSAGQLAYARARPGAALARFSQGDAQALPFADAAFDIAAMALVIAFVPEPQKAAAEMARVTRPGGLVATYMWDFVGGGAPVDPIYKALEANGIAAPLPPRAEAASEAALRRLWDGAGLLSVETRVIRIQIVHESFDAFWDSNCAPSGMQGRMLHAMSPAEQERMRAQLRGRLPIAADGSIRYEAFANAVKGYTPD